MTTDHALRICMIVRALPYHRTGGLEFHTWDLCKELARRGHNVVILTSSIPASERFGDIEAGLTIQCIPGSTPGDYSLAYFRNAEREVARLDQQHAFDIIHAQEFSGLFLRPRPGKYVVTVHGTMTSETPLWREHWQRLNAGEKLSSAWRFKSRVALMPAFTRMLKRADRLIVDSDFTRRELISMNARLATKVTTIPLGVDPARYPEVERTSHSIPRIGILGRVQKMKGLEIAVRAARILQQRGIPFEMKIAGSGEYAAGMQKVIDALGMQNSVRYMGRLLDDAAVAQFLANLDMFLFPDLTQPAFGLVAVEAMRYGVPVVGARSGAIPEVVTEDAGWTYNPWSVEDLANTLQQALADKAMLAARSVSAKARARQFTATVMAEQVEQVYRGLKN